MNDKMPFATSAAFLRATGNIAFGTVFLAAFMLAHAQKMPVINTNGSLPSIANALNNVTVSNASTASLSPPVILSKTPSTNQIVDYRSLQTLQVSSSVPGQNSASAVSYQWQFDGMHIPYARMAIYKFRAVNSGTYSVIVSNAAGSASAAWQVMVFSTNGLHVTRQPGSLMQSAGTTVIFLASAVSSNTVTYQWQFNGTNLPGATGSVLMLTNAQAAQQGRYNVIVSDGVNELASSNAWFYQAALPEIVSQTPPTNAVLTFDKYVTLNVVASSPGQTNGFPLTYQWQFNGKTIYGATLSNYFFFADAHSPGTYSVVISNAVGSVSAVWQVGITYAGSYIAPGTLAYCLSTNAVAHAKGHSPDDDNMLELANWKSSSFSAKHLAFLISPTWSTNCWLYGVKGLSATCIGYNNSFSGQFLITMVSPRHYLRAHHVGAPGGLIAFLSTNNVVYWRKSLQQVQVGNSDTDVGILNFDLPPSVGYLPVMPAIFTNFLPSTFNSYVQGIGLHQDFRLFSQPMMFYSADVGWNSRAAPPFGLGTNWDITLFAGDSSNPDMFLIGNQLVLVSHHFTAGGGPDYAFQADEINRQMHYLSKNNRAHTDYQLTSFSITNWPVINP